MKGSFLKFSVCHASDHTGKEPGANTPGQDKKIPIGPLDV